MSRSLKIESGLVEQLRKLNKSTISVNNAIVWAGVIASGPYAGLAATVIDLTTGATGSWATGNNRVIVVAVPSEQNLPITMRTQSHSAGQYLEGSYSLRAYMESPATFTSTLAKFVRSVGQVIVGQNAAPCEFFFGSATVNPQIEGVNGASSGNETSSAFVSAGFDFPLATSAYTGGI